MQLRPGREGAPDGVWLGFTNQTPDESFETAEFGHYEDRYMRIGGRWYFQERRIFNERLSEKAIFYPELPLWGA